MKQQIFLTGLSGSGKSTVGCLVARLLGWDYIDTDDLLFERAGLPVGQILVEYGEQRFRELESEVLQSAARRDHVVIATGGGAVITEANRTLMREHGLVVYLQVSIVTAWQRIQEHLLQCGTSAVRPLVAGADGQQRLQDLFSVRKQWYEQASVHINTDEHRPEIVACQIVAFALALGYLRPHQQAEPNDVGGQFIVPSPGSISQEGAIHYDPALPPGFSHTLTLKSGTAFSQAIVEWGGLHHMPEMLQAAGLPHRMFIVTDTKVGQIYTEPIQNLLQGAGFAPHILTIPAGESSKSLDYWQQILNWLVENKAERQEPLVALGGGVVGDLTGFVAACYHRGIPLIQIPTSLLAQVDSAIGGKTGINHTKGKNLIGAIYQPRLIIVDPACLLTLPERVYREGWAEIVKYGMILDADLFDLLETYAPSLYARNMDASLLTTIISRCIQLKMEVVAADERDSGLRNILNYGHTFGHALEALTDYGTWLHGEAVSIGMEVATHIALARGILSDEDASRQRQLLQTLGLPIHCSDIDTESILMAMQRDKKVRSGRMRWVLPTRIGHAEVYDDISLEMVRDAVEAVQNAE